MSLTLVNVPLIPFSTVISFDTKPTTGSLNLIVYVMLFTFVTSVVSANILTIGLISSITTLLSIPLQLTLLGYS